MKKKSMNLLVIFMACICLVGCGKSESVTKTEELIESIGTVDENSGDAIEDAQKQYDALSDSDKEKVSNYAILQEAMESYNVLMSAKVETNLDNAYQSLVEAKEYCDDLCGIIYEYWNYNGFECFFDRDEWTRMNKEHNYGGEGSLARGTFYGDSNTAFENRETIEELLQSTKNDLNLKNIPDEHKDYYDAVKDLYLMISEYASFASGFPEGYSKISYSSTHSDYQSKYNSCISEIEFLK